METNQTFLAYKVKRQIELNKQVYTFRRCPKDANGCMDINQYESFSDIPLVTEIKGLWHSVFVNGANSITQVVLDSGKQRTGRIPCILCLMEDVNAADIQVDDLVFSNSNLYRVIGISDIGELGVIADISLELKDSAYYI